MYKLKIKNNIISDLLERKNSDANLGSQWRKYLNTVCENDKFFNKTFITNNITNIFSQINSGFNIGVAYGSVQSGKTKNMISMIPAAFDNGYNVIIILGGTMNLLLNQNKERFYKTLEHDLDFRWIENISNVNDSFIRELLHAKKRIVIPLLKGSVQIKKMFDKWKNVFDEKNILILDDECDISSLDHSKVTNEKKTYKEIVNIMKYSKKCSYVGFTATPFANILCLDRNILKPSYVVPLQKDEENYCGLSKFHIPNSDNIKIIDYNNICYKKFSEIIFDHLLRTKNSESSQLLWFDSIRTKEHELMKKTMKRWISDLKINKKILCSTLNKNNNSLPVCGHQIIIGGHLMSRGVTFNNLATQLIYTQSDRELNNNKYNADTLLQRARWFGYRKNFNKIKIYMGIKMSEAFNELRELEEMLLQSFKVSFTLSDRKRKLIKEIFSELTFLKYSGKKGI